MFTAFRQALERADLRPRAPIATPALLPPSPAGIRLPRWEPSGDALPSGAASFPFDDPVFGGAETAAQAHLGRYFRSMAPQTYKLTRNGLSGTGYSTKRSPWLAVGAQSPRPVFEHLAAHEARCGANESTDWIWFELLWRDFFRFWGMQHDSRLFGPRGLGGRSTSGHDPQAFARWCGGATGPSLVDAGLHDLGGDHRAGAARFESRLIDYDLYSN